MPYKNPKELFVAICDAIREKDGIKEKIPHKSIPEYILAINLKLEVTSLTDAHYWEKYTSGDMVQETAVENYQLSNHITLNDSVIYGLTHYADEIQVVNGVISLVDPQPRGDVDLMTLAGKYIANNTDYYRIPADAKIKRRQGTYNISVEADLVYKLAAEAGGTFVGYVISDKQDDYPLNGDRDGYTYVYKGTLESTSSPAVIEPLTVTENGTYAPPSGVNGFSPVTVNVQGGTALPTLENPGSADDLVEGKELIDQNGNVVTGTIRLAMGQMFTGLTPEFSEDGSKVTLKAELSHTSVLQSGGVISMSANVEKWTGGSY